MTGKRQTRAQLEARIAQLDKELVEGAATRDAVRAELRSLQEAQKRTSSQLDDLKTRLVLAEAENQRMRGYIQRVQEDDVVREDLVKVGDPEGSHQLVPKRKPSHFNEPEPFRGAGCNMATDSFADRMMRDRAPPKHWVTY